MKIESCLKLLKINEIASSIDEIPESSNVDDVKVSSPRQAHYAFTDETGWCSICNRRYLEESSHLVPPSESFDFLTRLSTAGDTLQEFHSPTLADASAGVASIILQLFDDYDGTQLQVVELDILQLRENKPPRRISSLIITLY